MYHTPSHCPPSWPQPPVSVHEPTAAATPPGSSLGAAADKRASVPDAGAAAAPPPKRPRLADGPGQPEFGQQLRQLVAMGFAEQDCRAMLELTGGEIDAAARLLLG